MQLEHEHGQTGHEVGKHHQSVGHQLGGDGDEIDVRLLATLVLGRGVAHGEGQRGEIKQGRPAGKVDEDLKLELVSIAQVVTTCQSESKRKRNVGRIYKTTRVN